MNTKLSRGLAALAMLPGVLAAALSPRPAEAVAIDRSRVVTLSASVLKIEVDRAQGGFSVGSGVVVAADKIVTNCHVTRDAERVHVLRGGVRWRVESQAADPELDVCVLHVPALRGAPVVLRPAADLHSGAPLAALGYTAGAGLQVSDGVIHSLHRYAGSRVPQVTNSFSSGASGGGLFDADLRLVGVLTFRLRGGQVHYFAAPTDWIGPLLGDASRFHPIAPLPNDALAYWQRQGEAQPRFLLAASLDQARRWDELLTLGQRWADVDPTDAEPEFLRGRAYAQLGRADDAREALHRALQRDPAWLPALHQLGLVLVGQQRIAAARALQRQLQAPLPTLADELQSAIDHACASPAADAAACRAEPA